MSQKAKAAEMSAGSLKNTSTTPGNKLSPEAMSFLMNGIGGGVGGTNPRGAAPPTSPTWRVGGGSIEMPGLAPLQGQGWDSKRVGALTSGDYLGGLAPKVAETGNMLGSAYNYLTGAGTVAATGAAADAAAASEGTGILSSLLSFLA